MRNRFLLLALLLAVATPAAAQITPPYTFTNGTVADADQINADMAKLGDALNRTGGTMTGSLTTLDVLPTTTNTSAIGSSSTRYATIYGVNANFSGLLTLSGFGQHNISGGGTGGNIVYVENPTSGTANYGRVAVVAGTTQGFLTANSQGFTGTASNPASGIILQSAGTGGLYLQATDAAGVIKFFSGGTTARATLNADGTWSLTGASLTLTNASANLMVTDGTITTTVQPTFIGTSSNHAVKFVMNGGVKWGINTAGDFTVGSSSNIAFSSGVPTYSSCTGGGCSGTVAGSDISMLVTPTSATSVSVNFGHTWNNVSCGQPANNTAGTTDLRFSSFSTTGFTISWGGTMPTSLMVVCAGR